MTNLYMRGDVDDLIFSDVYKRQPPERSFK